MRYSYSWGIPAALVTTLLATIVACGGVGSAPEILPIPDQVAYVGSELRIELTATDFDAGELEYSFSSTVADLHKRASLSRTSKGDGIFRWVPRGSDVGVAHIDFVASDGDHQTTLTVRIDVQAAAAGTPVFKAPTGTGRSHDFARDPCIDLEIIVDDPDSTEVVIAEEEPRIDGAELDAGGLAATWHWCPTPKQIAAELQYHVQLSADDHTNPKVIWDYLIVLRTPDCADKGPVITHTPADVVAKNDLTIDAIIEDDKGLAHDPLVYYSTSPVDDPSDLSKLIQVTMLSIGDSVWAADVPNPVRGQPGGTTAHIYYVIVADSEGEQGACQSRSPAEGTHVMQVTSPAGPGVCADDGLEDDDRPSQARKAGPTERWDRNMLCSFDQDWYGLFLLEGDRLVVDLTFAQTRAAEDLDIHFHDSSGVDLTPCSPTRPEACNPGNGQSSDANERFVWTTPPGGDGKYYVVVRGRGAASNSYGIRFQYQ